VPRHVSPRMNLQFTTTADDQLDRLPHRLQTRIVEKIEFYVAQSEPLKFAEPLTGSTEYRFRIGDYRVIFEVLHETLWVTAIKRRDEAYR
jgi:mRNA interferase RelE/StbE